MPFHVGVICFCLEADNLLCVAAAEERPSALALSFATAVELHRTCWWVQLRFLRSCSAGCPVVPLQVVGDVLQRYCDAPQTALEQLIMLSSCVADADAAHPSLPNRHAWEQHPAPVVVAAAAAARRTKSLAAAGSRPIAV
jgi:hypothetical protein